MTRRWQRNIFDFVERLIISKWASRAFSIALAKSKSITRKCFLTWNHKVPTIILRHSRRHLRCTFPLHCSRNPRLLAFVKGKMSWKILTFVITLLKEVFHLHFNNCLFWKHSFYFLFFTRLTESCPIQTLVKFIDLSPLIWTHFWNDKLQWKIWVRKMEMFGNVDTNVLWRM